MNKKATLSLLALGLAAGMTALSVSATAADVSVSQGDAYGPWMFRLRGIYVMPHESTDLNAAGADASISDAVVPELDISYFLTKNIAAELILATTNHDVHGEGTISTADLGDVWLLPPTLTAQYHFNLTDSIKPYVGAGINYTLFYGESDGGMVDVDYKNSFGWALQAGVDIAAGDNWGVNLDVKKLFLDTKVRVDTGAGIVKGDVNIDPWIFGAGLYYRY
ncbi:MAG: OmpW family protein [Rhizobiales bacterium]|nr:OmpW family protein [Hyphomicrobiales bacterium]